MHYMTLDKKLNILMKKKKDDQVDYTLLIMGLMTFLNQFHHSNTEILLGQMAQHIKSGLMFIQQIKDAKVIAETKAEIANHVFFFEDFIRYSGQTMEVYFLSMWIL